MYNVTAYKYCSHTNE